MTGQRALPVHYEAAASPARLERATSSFAGWRSSPTELREQVGLQPPGAGSEIRTHTGHKTRDGLSVVCLPVSASRPLATQVGFEPTLNALTGRRATVTPPGKGSECRERDSNPHEPQDSRRSERRLSASFSTPAKDQIIAIWGVPGANRTHGHLLRRQVLYPLSYGNIERRTSDWRWRSLAGSHVQCDNHPPAGPALRLESRCQETDSNRRRPPLQSGALPLSYPDEMEPRGVEPRPPTVRVSCSPT